MLSLNKSYKNRIVSHTIHCKYKYFDSALQRAEDRRQKFAVCRLPFAVNVKLNLSIKASPLKSQIKISFASAKSNKPLCFKRDPVQQCNNYCRLICQCTLYFSESGSLEQISFPEKTLPSRWC